jgi:hypothetical protein
MADKPRDVIVPIVFDEETLATDLKHFPDAAGTGLAQLRREVNHDGGLPKSRLKRCEPEGRDGSRLPGCVKTRVPWPDGPWDIVFRAGQDPNRPFALYTLAYGHRHPTGPGKLSVYEVAGRRLAEIVARDLRGKDSGKPAAEDTQR